MNYLRSGESIEIGAESAFIIHISGNQLDNSLIMKFSLIICIIINNDHFSWLYV